MPKAERTTVDFGCDLGEAASEVNRLSLELLHILWEAEDAVRAKLQHFTQAPYLDAASLYRVQSSAVELAGQAALLARLLRRSGADDVLLVELLALSHFFRDAEDQIGSLH